MRDFSKFGHISHYINTKIILTKSITIGLHLAMPNLNCFFMLWKINSYQLYGCNM